MPGSTPSSPAPVRDGGPGPVPAAEGVRTLEVLDAARRSALENRVVELGGQAPE